MNPGSAEADELRALLAERLTQAREQLTSLTVAIDAMRTARSLTFADDEHDPEGSTVSLDQARDVALLAQVERTLVQLAAAAGRLEDGTYGGCERCGAVIPTERLRARPESQWCVGCAARRTRRA